MAFTGIIFQVYFVFGKKKKLLQGSLAMAFTGIIFQVHFVFGEKKNSNGYHSPLQLACEEAPLGFPGIRPKRPGRAFSHATLARVPPI